MHLELPQDLIDRVQQRAAASNGATDADVIRQALDSLEWREQERQAIQEGIDAWRRRDFQGLTGQLPDWCDVYEGLSSEEIAELERSFNRDRRA